MLERFDRQAFRQASDAERKVLCEQLTAAISARIRSADDFLRCMHDVVAELRAAGHDLWSFDTDGATFELWCPNWVTPTGPGIIVYFRNDGACDVSWSPR